MISYKQCFDLNVQVQYDWKAEQIYTSRNGWTDVPGHRHLSIARWQSLFLLVLVGVVVCLDEALPDGVQDEGALARTVQLLQPVRITKRRRGVVIVRAICVL